MSFYTISVTPDDTTRASTTLRVDLSDKTPRITELIVRAGADSGLSAHAIPAVDLDLLLRAISPGPAAVRAAAAPPAAPVTTAPADTTAAQAGARTAEAAESTPTTARRRAGRLRKDRSTAAKPARAAAAKDTEPAGRSGRTRKESPRAYRRAPEDLVEVYQRVGGVTALADHYQVPRHTAQSWVRRLRGQGVLTGNR